MATKTVHVCDICGDDAVTTRRIDVCKAHSDKATARSRAAQNRPPAKLIKCAICGKRVKEGAGFAAHKRRAHPDEP